MATKNMLVRVGADFSGFISQSKSGAKAAQNWASQTTAAYSKVSKLTSMIAGAFSIAAISKGIQAIGNAISSVVEFGDTIDKESQKVGMSAESWQEWDYVLQLAGSSMESAKAGFRTLTNQIDAAKTGSTTATTAFNKLGISLSDLNEMSREEALTAAIEGMQGLADSTERAALANDLFGRSGSELAPLFNMSAEQTQQLIQNYRDLGNVMTTAEVKACADFNDALTTLKATFTSIGNSVVVAVLPAFQSFVNFLTYTVAPVVRSVAQTIANIMSSLFGVSFSSSGGSALSGAASDASDLSDSLSSAGGSAKTLNKQLMGFDEINKLQSQSSGGGGGGSVSSAVSDVIATGGALSTVSTAVDKVSGALSRLKGWFDSLNLEPITTAWENLKLSISNLAGVLSGAFAWAWENIMQPLARWTIEEAAPVLMNALASAIDFVAAAWDLMLPGYEKFYELVAIPVFSLGGAALLDFIDNLATSLNHITNALKYIKSGEWKPALSELWAGISGEGWTSERTDETISGWQSKIAQSEFGQKVATWSESVNDWFQRIFPEGGTTSAGSFASSIGERIGDWISSLGQAGDWLEEVAEEGAQSDGSPFAFNQATSAYNKSAATSAKKLIQSVNQSLKRSGTVLEVGVESADQVDGKISGTVTALQSKLSRNPLIASISAPESSSSQIVKAANNITARISSKLSPITVSPTLDSVTAGKVGSDLMSAVKVLISTVSISASASESSGITAGSTLMGKALSQISTAIISAGAKTGGVSTDGTGEKTGKTIIDKVQSYFSSNIPAVPSSVKSGKVTETGTAEKAGSDILSAVKSKISVGVSVPASAHLSNPSSAATTIATALANAINGKQIKVSTNVKTTSSGSVIASISANLNAAGGIFPTATLLGGGNIVGEAGAEAVIPLENNLGYMDSWAETLASKMAAQGGSNVPITLMLDGQVLTNVIVRRINGQARNTGINPLSAYI